MQLFFIESISHQIPYMCNKARGFSIGIISFDPRNRQNAVANNSLSKFSQRLMSNHLNDVEWGFRSFIRLCIVILKES